MLRRVLDLTSIYKGSVEGEEVDRVVSPPILKREEEQRASPLWVTGEPDS